MEGDNAFPEPWREASDAFWGLELPEAPDATQPVPAAELIVETVSRSAEPVRVFVSGTHTNLAEALRLEHRPESDILPVLARGETVIISAHGNSLRALVKHLSQISDEDITDLEIPTGQPIVYQFDAAMNPGERRYLKDL